MPPTIKITFSENEIVVDLSAVAAFLTERVAALRHSEVELAGYLNNGATIARCLPRLTGVGSAA